MNIVMMTNTYLPIVGGVAHSVATFTEDYRARGHRVLVVAPQTEGAPADEEDVVRVPAIQHFNGSDFAAPLPAPGRLNEALDAFRPDLIHAHHPYLLGMTALRVARSRDLPLVFTHHTRYELYTHYVPADSPAFRRFVIELATRYANLCDQVFAPSESIAELIRARGVRTPIDVVPTGVDVAVLARGDGAAFRARHGIPPDAFVVGHLGRLAPEKNLAFLAEAVACFLSQEPRAVFLLVGLGPAEEAIRHTLARAGLLGRLYHAGVLRGRAVADAYRAMDVFAFASQSETQGMVLVEAMAAGVPVVGLDAPGVRDVLRDRVNGRLLYEETVNAFCGALHWVVRLPDEARERLREGARATAREFSRERCAERALACYERLLSGHRQQHPAAEYEQWERLRHLLRAEWEIVKGLAASAASALVEPAEDDGTQ